MAQRSGRSEPLLFLLRRKGSACELLYGFITNPDEKD
jgi:hypothetical protein